MKTHKVFFFFPFFLFSFNFVELVFVSCMKGCLYSLGFLGFREAVSGVWKWEDYEEESWEAAFVGKEEY